MTITKIPFQHQLCAFSYLDERDLHFVWRSSKKLQQAANDHRLWRPFLEKRCIRLDAPDYHRRITEYFTKCCALFGTAIIPNEYAYALSTCARELRQRQYHADQQGQNDDRVILSKARYEEIMGPQHLDVYDVFASFVRFRVDQTKRQAEHGLNELLDEDDEVPHGLDPDLVRFTLELGADPSYNRQGRGSPLQRDSPLELVLKHYPNNVEALQVLWRYSRPDDPTINARRTGRLPWLLNIAAAYGRPPTFQFILSLHPQPSPPRFNEHGGDRNGFDMFLASRGTLGNVILNRHLVSHDGIIKRLLDAKAEISEKHPVYDLYPTMAVPYRTHGTFNCALGRYFHPATMQVLLDAGAKPNATVIENGRPILGSIDTALEMPPVLIHQRPDVDCIKWLLSLGAPLSLPSPGWYGTLELARINNAPPEIMQLLEEAARIQFGQEEKKSSPPPNGDAAEPVAPEEMPPIAAVEPIAQPMSELEVIVQAPVAVANLLPPAPRFDQPQNREPEAEPSLLEQLLPRWLWRILQPIGQFISALFSRIARGV